MVRRYKTSIGQEKVVYTIFAKWCGARKTVFYQTKIQPSFKVVNFD